MNNEQIKVRFLGAPIGGFLGRGKPGIHPHAPLVTVTEDPDLLLVLLYLDDDVRLVLARQEVSRYAGRDNDEKESENDNGQPETDHPPVIQKVQLGFRRSRVL